MAELPLHLEKSSRCCRFRAAANSSEALEATLAQRVLSVPTAPGVFTMHLPADGTRFQLDDQNARYTLFLEGFEVSRETYRAWADDPDRQFLEFRTMFAVWHHDIARPVCWGVIEGEDEFFVLMTRKTWIGAVRDLAGSLREECAAIR